jgi:hypothetical protein
LLGRSTDDRRFWRESGLLIAFVSIAGGRVSDQRLIDRYNQAPSESRRRLAMALLSISERYPKRPSVKRLGDTVARWVRDGQWGRGTLTRLRGDPPPRNPERRGPGLVDDLVQITGLALLITLLVSLALFLRPDWLAQLRQVFRSAGL